MHSKNEKEQRRLTAFNMLTFPGCYTREDAETILSSRSFMRSHVKDLKESTADLTLDEKDEFRLQRLRIYIALSDYLEAVINDPDFPE